MNKILDNVLACQSVNPKKPVSAKVVAISRRQEMIDVKKKTVGSGQQPKSVVRKLRLDFGNFFILWQMVLKGLKLRYNSPGTTY